MQDKKGKNLSLIPGAVIIMLLTVQIIAGIIWSVLNFPFIQEFPDTKDMYLLSSSLSLKGDTGIIYPALLLLVRTLTADHITVTFMVMYVIQLALALSAWFLFAKNVIRFKKKSLNVWFALAVVTCPYAMQCHMAILEYSFISSFLCLLITFQIIFIRDWKDENKHPGTDRALRDISVTSLFWLLLALTRIEYMFIGAVPVVILLIVILEHSDTKKVLAKISPIILVMVFAAIIMMTDGLFRDHDRHTFSDIVKRAPYIRLAYSEDLYDEDYWPYYLYYISDDHSALQQSMEDASAVRTALVPYVEEAYGEETTSNVFFYWAGIVFPDNKKNIVKYFALDLTGYIFPPFENEVILRGSAYPGFAPGSYDVMRRHTPVFTKYYLRGATLIYMFLFPITLILMILARKKRVITFTVSGIVIVMSVCSVIYTFYGSNVWDHRKALFATCMWIAGFAFEGIAMYERGTGTGASETADKEKQ